MANRLLMTSLAAGCWLAAAPQVATDAPGVTVTLNGASVLHRTGVPYPSGAQHDGVQGTLSLQVKLDSSGAVSDAQVLSGPEELRKAALQSVLQWHFGREVAGSTRSIQITFEIPKSAAATALPAPPPEPVIQPGTVRSVQVLGISDQATTELLATLPIREGGQWTAETAAQVSHALKAFDEHLTIRQSSMSQYPNGSTQVDLVISAGVQSIKVGGNVQSAMLVSKTPPVYPADAKAAGIQGSVHLSAIIGMDGTVQSVTVLDGPPELTQAATDAVKQWVYKPTVLNGNPAQVQTTIDVSFVLNK
jgi:TonB family protein